MRKFCCPRVTNSQIINFVSSKLFLHPIPGVNSNFSCLCFFPLCKHAFHIMIEVRGCLFLALGLSGDVGDVVCSELWFLTTLDKPSVSTWGLKMHLYPAVHGSPKIPEAGGARMCNLGLLLAHRDFPGSKGNPTLTLGLHSHLPPVKNPLELILGFSVLQELTEMDHLEENKNTPSVLSLYFIFPTEQELFVFVFNSESLAPLNSQIGSFLLSFWLKRSRFEVF